MALSRSYTISILLLIFISCCSCYLDTLYTSSDKEYLANLIESSQDEKSGLFEKSLTTTFYATEALGIYYGNKGRQSFPKSDKLCSTLQNYKISSWEEFYNLLLARSRINNCLNKISDNSLKKLNDGQTQNKLSKVFYSISGIYTLSKTNKDLYDTSSLDIVKLLKHIKSFQLNNKLFTEQVKSSKSKSSVHKSSMALSAVAKLLSLPYLTDAQKQSLKSDEVKDLLNAFMDAANALVKDYSKISSNMISYSNSLTATSVVLEAINEFVNAISSISGFEGKFTKFEDGDFVENVVRYILTFRSTTSPTTARHVVVLMNSIKTSKLFEKSRPITIQISNRIFNDDEPSTREQPLTVSITDVYGGQVLAGNDKTSLSITQSKETTIKKEGATGKLTQKDSNTYEFAFGSEIRKLKFDDGSYGIYKLKIKVTDDKLDSDLTIETSVKVMTSVAKAVFGIQYSKKSDDGYNRVTYPNSMKDVYDVSPSQKVKLEVQARSIKKPSMIVIDFIDPESGESAMQVVPKTRQEKYGITMDLNKDAFKGLYEGKFKISLYVSDELYREQIVWDNIVTVNVIEEEDEAEVDYEPVNDEVPPWKPKASIEHTFAGKEAEPLALFPMLFSGVVLFPLLYFIYYIFISMGTSIEWDREVQLSSLLFMITLTGIGFILFLFWYQWNIFEAGGWLCIAAIPAFFFGYNVLKNRLITRNSKTKSH